MVAHNLTVMIALSDGAAYTLRDDPDAAEHALETASRTGRLALAEMRRLLGVLRQDHAGPAPEHDPQPGVPEIDRVVEQVRAAGLPVSYRVSPDARGFPRGSSCTLFRIVQEALTNTLKHAGPSATAEVELIATGAEVSVWVADTGPQLFARRPQTAARGCAECRSERPSTAAWSRLGRVPRADGGWPPGCRCRCSAPNGTPHER